MVVYPAHCSLLATLIFDVRFDTLLAMNDRVRQVKLSLLQRGKWRIHDCTSNIREGGIGCGGDCGGVCYCSWEV